MKCSGKNRGECLKQDIDLPSFKLDERLNRKLGRNRRFQNE